MLRHLLCTIAGLKQYLGIRLARFDSIVSLVNIDVQPAYLFTFEAIDPLCSCL